jgi:hypothetical protein
MGGVMRGLVFSRMFELGVSDELGGFAMGALGLRGG